MPSWRQWLENNLGRAAPHLPTVMSVLLAVLLLADAIAQGYMIVGAARALPRSQQPQSQGFDLKRLAHGSADRAASEGIPGGDGLDVQPVVAAHLFGTSESAAPAAAFVARALTLHLTGTIAVEDAPEKGLAMVAGPDNVQHLITGGDLVEADRTLVGVYPDHIVFNHLGALETLSMPKPTAVVRVTKYVAVVNTDDPETIEKRVDKAAGEYSRMLRVDDNDGSGRFKGVTFSEDTDAAGLGTLGLHPGDKLVSVNGVRVTSPEALEELSTGGVVALGVQGENGYHLVKVDSSRLR